MEIKLNETTFKNLDSLSITFPQNKITALIGNNESGKTEVLNLICGLQKIKSGTINYFEKKLDSNSSSKEYLELQRNVYYLKENSKNMLFNINIKEDIKFYLGKYNEEKPDELLKNFNLGKSILNNAFFELSSSEIQKILLIIGLMSSAKIIVFDLSSLSLDNKSLQAFIKLLKKQKRKDKIIIVSSYNTNFLLEISDKVIALNNRKVIKEGNKFDVFSDEKLLSKIDLHIPNIIKFINKVRELKDIKINYTDNINDLIKDIYRHAK